MLRGTRPSAFSGKRKKQLVFLDLQKFKEYNSSFDIKKWIVTYIVPSFQHQTDTIFNFCQLSSELRTMFFDFH